MQDEETETIQVVPPMRGARIVVPVDSSGKADRFPIKGETMAMEVASLEMLRRNQLLRRVHAEKRMLLVQIAP